MVWCGVVWCGVVWIGVVRCGAVRCGVSAAACSDDLAALQQFAESLEDPDEVVDAAAGETATDNVEAVLIDQM